MERQAAMRSSKDIIDLTDSPPPPPRTVLARKEPLSTGQASSFNQGMPPLRPKQTTMAPPNYAASSLHDRSANSNAAPAAVRNRDHDGPSNGQTYRNTPVSDFYLKPATKGAFDRHPPQSHKGSLTSKEIGHRSNMPSSTTGWPAWLIQQPGVRPDAGPEQPAIVKTAPPNRSLPDEPEDGERFDIDAAAISAADYNRHDGDAEAHMRELLSGAIGTGEEGPDDAEGSDVVDGFAKNIRLMPHQIRGVRWMRMREGSRKTGGILADDMGLGKTIQTLACIVGGPPSATDRRNGFKGGTLIVAPLAVIEQWAAEIRQKTAPGRVKVLSHHGPKRTTSSRTLEQYDVVITTFQTLASEHATHEAGSVKEVDSDASSADESALRRKTRGKKPAPHALYGVKWHRIVIDEAHNIRNRTTKASKAAVALASKYRWCLTGTPIQNNVEELYALFSFLRAKPLDDWKVFKERILSPVKQGQTKLAMKRLQVLLKAIMLRRTKDATIDGKPILKLPGRTVEIVDCPFDPEERAFYDALEKQTSLTFNKFLRQGSAMANFTSVLTMLLRLRQACDHPSLVTTSIKLDADAVAPQGSDAARDDFDAEADALAALLGGLNVAEKAKCAICNTPLNSGESEHCAGCSKVAESARRRAVTEREDMPPISAKIRVILQLLRQIDDRSRSSQKTILFSQFTSFLNLIEPFLHERGVQFVRYDGSMRNDKRLAALETIRSSKDVRLILISFKAGSTGLNLTCCNNVILTDLWWNPALEDQAFDRAHRLGQTLDVNIYKLTVKETVEDRILALQEQKRELAQAALSGKSVRNISKLTLNDLMALFRSGPGASDDADSDDGE